MPCSFKKPCHYKHPDGDCHSQVDCDYWKEPCCKHCDDGTGDTVFPYFGLPPHVHGTTGEAEMEEEMKISRIDIIGQNGPTGENYDEAKPAHGDPVSGWKPWFAWHPVETFDGGWKWMKRIQRRRIQLHQYLRPDAPHFWWQYRDKQEANNG